MSTLQWLELTNFRNFTSIRFEPDPTGLTVITGPNGSGKTSLLEAVGYCSLLRSFRDSPREALISAGQDRAILRAETSENNRDQLVEVELRAHQSDRVQLNRQRPKRIDELLEALRVTIFTPDHIALVKGGPAERREFLDDTLTSARPRYASIRQSVERVLRQRATLLKQAGGVANAEILASLDVWDAQLSTAGEALIAAREELTARLQPIVQDFFRRLSASSVAVELVYQRSFDGSLVSALEKARREDLRRGITTVGPHRDELIVTVDGLDVRTRISQGRQRAATLSLRLAAHQVVSEEAHTLPVLLLDDVFSELDARTQAALVAELPPGQAILTTAETLPEVLARPALALRLSEGSFQ